MEQLLATVEGITKKPVVDEIARNLEGIF